MTDETETLDQALARFARFQKQAVRQRLLPYRRPCRLEARANRLRCHQPIGRKPAPSKSSPDRKAWKGTAQQ